MSRILVSGAGGFIGSHLVKYLKDKGHYVKGVDIKRPEFSKSVADRFELLDLRYYDNCVDALRPIWRKSFDQVYHLAANMGGIGFIETHKAEIVKDNTLIDINMLEAAKSFSVGKFLYTSSACVYPGYKQKDTEVVPLKEEDAYPADAEDGYGWEKLYIERLCRHYMEEYKVKTHIVRFHNIYGPEGTYDGGREKSPAAICRKIALCSTGEIEVWGDGLQTRSYCYIDDCVEGLYRLMNSDYYEPLNLGTDRMVSINELVDIVSAVAKKPVKRYHDLTKPQGVRGRNSDNTKLKQVLGWEPKIKLEDGLKKTYDWIYNEVHHRNPHPELLKVFGKVFGQY